MAVSIPDLSKELNIKFENLLAGIAREELCALISYTEFGKYLWLSSPDDMGVDIYKARINRTIRYAYVSDERFGAQGESTPGAPMSKAICETILAAISGENEKDSISGKVIEEGVISLEVRIDGMRVPMKIEITPAYTRKRPVFKSVNLIRTGEKFVYLHYPMEAEIAESICTIVKELELIDDIAHYDKVFSEITSSPVEGKLVWAGIKDGLIKRNVKVDEDLIKIIRDYPNNKYMAKRWDNYRKRHYNKSLDWKKIITAINIFLTPIWDAIIEDRPFVGDWMPELGRFL